MGSYADEDILGLDLDGRITCRECATDEEWKNMKENEIIVEDEDRVVFCDRCKNKL